MIYAHEEDGIIYSTEPKDGETVYIGAGWEGFETIEEVFARWPEAELNE